MEKTDHRGIIRYGCDSHYYFERFSAKRDGEHHIRKKEHHPNGMNDILLTPDGVNDHWRSENVGITAFDNSEKRIFRVEERTGDAIQRALNEKVAAATAASSNEEGARVVLFSGDYIVRNTVVLKGSKEGTTRLAFTNRGPGILVESASGCCRTENDDQSRKIHEGSATSQSLIVDAHTDFQPNTYAWINVVKTTNSTTTSAVAGQMVKMVSVRKVPNNDNRPELTIEGPSVHGLGLLRPTAGRL